MAKAAVLISALLVVLAAVSIQAASIKSVVEKAANVDGVEYIAGFVLYRVIDGNIQYVLLQNKTELDDWSVPKGHIEAGEDANLGAIRETFEVTSYLETDYTIFSEEEIYFEYLTNAGDEKKVTLFPAKLNSVFKPVILDPVEHIAYTWVDYESGVNIIKEQYKNAFISAHSYIIDQEGL